MFSFSVDQRILAIALVVLSRERMENMEMQEERLRKGLASSEVVVGPTALSE